MRVGERKQNAIKSVQKMNFSDEEQSRAQLHQLFEESKKLVNEAKNSENFDGCVWARAKLCTIYKLSVRRLNSRAKMPLRSYIGFLSIFSFIRSFDNNFCISLNFHPVFYRNLNSYARQAYQLWDTHQGALQSQQYLVCLSTLLFNLCTFTDSAKTFEDNIEVRKIFNKGLVDLILRMKLPAHEKIMRHYKIIMLHIMREAPDQIADSPALESIVQNLLHFSHSSPTQITLLYIILKIKVNHSDINAAAFRQLIPELTRMLQTPQIDTSSVKLILLAGDKALRHCPASAIPLSAHQISKIVQSQMEAHERLKDLGCVIPRAIMALPNEDRQGLLREMMPYFHLGMGLDLLFYCLKPFTPQLHSELLQSGFWSLVVDELIKNRNSPNSRTAVLLKMVRICLRGNFSLCLTNSLQQTLQSFSLLDPSPHQYQPMELA